MPDFKYDVAFSLLASDASIGVSINERLKTRLKTFFYPDRQEEIAGQDGLEAFSAIFAETSRAVVVLYRENLGGI